MKLSRGLALLCLVVLRKSIKLIILLINQVNLLIGLFVPTPYVKRDATFQASLVYFCHRNEHFTILVLSPFVTVLTSHSIKMDALLKCSLVLSHPLDQKYQRDQRISFSFCFWLKRSSPTAPLSELLPSHPKALIKTHFIIPCFCQYYSILSTSKQRPLLPPFPSFFTAAAMVNFYSNFLPSNFPHSPSSSLTTPKRRFDFLSLPPLSHEGVLYCSSPSQQLNAPPTTFTTATPGYNVTLSTTAPKA